MTRARRARANLERRVGKNLTGPGGEARRTFPIRRDDAKALLFLGEPVALVAIVAAAKIHIPDIFLAAQARQHPMGEQRARRKADHVLRDAQA